MLTNCETSNAPFWVASELITKNCYSVDRSAGLEVTLDLFWCRTVVNLSTNAHEFYFFISQTKRPTLPT